MTIEFRGGPGSGHHGHKGRPGEVGGSAPGDGGGGDESVAGPNVERKIRAKFFDFATTVPGASMLFEAWDRAKESDDLREGVRENFTEGLADDIIEILDEDPDFSDREAGTGFFEVSPDSIGPREPLTTAEEFAAALKGTGVKMGESMPKASNMREGSEQRNKWVRAIAKTNTLAQLRDRQDDLNFDIVEAETDARIQEVRALQDLYADAVNYQQFPESRPNFEKRSIDPVKETQGIIARAFHPTMPLVVKAGEHE